MSPDSSKYFEAKLIERKDFSEDLWSIKIRSQTPLSFTPGQYATLGVEKDGKLIQRPYSIASAPHEDFVQFFFELVPEGQLTPLLHRLRVGDSVWVRNASKGKFVLDAESGRSRHFMVATVTGLAPFLAMVRDLRNREEAAPVAKEFQLVIVNAASRSWELGFREEMERHANELPWLEYIPSISRPWEDPDWKGEVGRCEDIVRKYFDAFHLSPKDTTAYLCGHPSMIENTKGILQRRGVDPDFLREEQYWVQR